MIDEVKLARLLKVEPARLRACREAGLLEFYTYGERILYVAGRYKALPRKASPHASAQGRELIDDKTLKKQLDMSANTLATYRREGEFVYFTVGKKILYLDDCAETFLLSGLVPADPKFRKI